MTHAALLQTLFLLLSSGLPILHDIRVLLIVMKRRSNLTRIFQLKWVYLKSGSRILKGGKIQRKWKSKKRKKLGKSFGIFFVSIFFTPMHHRNSTRRKKKLGWAGPGKEGCGDYIYNYNYNYKFHTVVRFIGTTDHPVPAHASTAPAPTISVTIPFRSTKEK